MIGKMGNSVNCILCSFFLPFSMKNTRKLSLKNLKLAAKASITIGFILAVSLILLIALSSVQAGTAVSSAINGEFSGIAAQNGFKITGPYQPSG